MPQNFAHVRPDRQTKNFTTKDPYSLGNRDLKRFIQKICKRLPHVLVLVGLKYEGFPLQFSCVNRIFKYFLTKKWTLSIFWNLFFSFFYKSRWIWPILVKISNFFNSKDLVVVIKQHQKATLENKCPWVHPKITYKNF